MTTRVRTLLLALAIGLLVPARALAHPGHGTTDPVSWRHYLTEPAHVAVLVGAIVTLAVAIAWFLRVRDRAATRRRQRPR